MVAAIVIIGVATSAVVFYLGMKYGSATEKIVVATALAEYGKLSAEATGLVQSVLSRLEIDYTKVYDEVVAEYNKIKKAL